MALSRVNQTKIQANTSQKGIGKSNNFQAPIAHIDNDKNCVDIAESNDLDNVDKSNTSQDHVGEDTYYLDTMLRAVTTFPSKSTVDYERNKPRALFLQCLDGGEMQHVQILTISWAQGELSIAIFS